MGNIHGHSFRITTFGEKVIDTFYVTDLTGHKIDNPSRQERVRRTLVAVIEEYIDTGGAQLFMEMIGGLPHGAFDIAIARAALKLSPSAAAIFIGCCSVMTLPMTSPVIPTRTKEMITVTRPTFKVGRAISTSFFLRRR